MASFNFLLFIGFSIAGFLKIKSGWFGISFDNAWSYWLAALFFLINFIAFMKSSQPAPIEQISDQTEDET